MQLLNSCVGSREQCCLCKHQGSVLSCCTTVPHCLTCVYPAAGNRGRAPPATAQASASLTARSSRGWTTYTPAGHLTLLAWCVIRLAGLHSMAAAGMPVHVIIRPTQGLQHVQLAGLQDGRACDPLAVCCAGMCLQCGQVTVMAKAGHCMMVMCWLPAAGRLWQHAARGQPACPAAGTMIVMPALDDH